MIEVALIKRGDLGLTVTARTEDEVAYLVLVILMKGGELRGTWNSYDWCAEIRTTKKGQVEAIYFNTGGSSQ